MNPQQTYEKAGIDIPPFEFLKYKLLYLDHLVLENHVALHPLVHGLT